MNLIYEYLHSSPRTGFHVIGFTEPLLVLDHFQKNSDLYWLIVSDIRMPYISDDIQFRTGLSLVKVDEYIEKPISLNDFMSRSCAIITSIFFILIFLLSIMNSIKF